MHFIPLCAQISHTSAGTSPPVLPELPEAVPTHLMSLVGMGGGETAGLLQGAAVRFHCSVTEIS